MLKYIVLYSTLLFAIPFYGQFPNIESYHTEWTSQSKNASESMPVGGGDVGMNVWVEQDNVYFYFSRSGTFDEHNTLLKLGRIKLELSPNPFHEIGDFKQKLHLKDGYATISQNGTEIKLWANVFAPVIQVSVTSAQKINYKISYESWRYKNRAVKGKANNANSYKWAPQGDVITYADTIKQESNSILFYHSNRDTTVFDVAVKQQQLEAVKDQMLNPLKGLIFGGLIQGNNLEAAGTYTGIYQNTDFKGFSLKSSKPARNQKFSIYLNTSQQESIESWNDELQQLVTNIPINDKKEAKKSIRWWNQFWDRSFIYTQKSHTSEAVYQIGRNYQLFRYMLGCNAYGKYPTKFNGGLFTYDPVYTDSTLTFTPDFRNWGGGTMTAQNQRLVYFPMLKSGDFDMMNAQLDYYLSILKNAELRTQTYWGHSGASFTEQLENFGLPNPAEYGWKRPADYDPGMQYNAWLEYEWDTVLEFCKMMLDQHRYAGKNVKQYIPFVLSCLQFFDEHYQYLAKERGSKALDGEGNLVLYPGSACETYKMAYNANATIAGLQVVSEELLKLPKGHLSDTEQNYVTDFLTRIPPLNFTTTNAGTKMLLPAKLWERVNNTELPQLYPVFPWKLYGVGKPDLEIAINTWKYDDDAKKFRSHIGWKQDNIFAADMGLTDEAAKYTLLKMADSGRRFPAFWGPGFDWVPDHNWGGSGMIGMQEMLLQTAANKIYIFPAWPKDWDVHFKLHAPQNTTVEASLINGKVSIIKVEPEERRKDIINLLNSAEQ